MPANTAKRPAKTLALTASIALLGAMTPAVSVHARPPLINLGPKAAPTNEPIEFSSGDNLSSATSRMIWQNEKGGVQGVRQVVIPSFQVEFVTHSGASSNGQGLAKASVNYTLLGPTEDDMQAIADAFYARFLTDLTAAGITVIPLDQALAKSPGLQRLMNMAKPTPYARGKTNRSAFYSPPGMKFYFTPNDGRATGFGDTMTTTGSQVPEEMAMKELDAGVMGVRMVVDFAEVEAQGRGILGMRPVVAKVKSKANVSLSATESQLWIVTPKAKSTVMDPGHRQRYALTTPILLPDSVLSARDATTRGTKTTDALVGVIGVLGGTGMSQKSRDYEVTVDPVVWRKDVTSAMGEVSRAMIARMKADL